MSSALKAAPSEHREVTANGADDSDRSAQQLADIRSQIQVKVKLVSPDQQVLFCVMTSADIGKCLESLRLQSASQQVHSCSLVGNVLDRGSYGLYGHAYIYVHVMYHILHVQINHAW